MEDLRDFLLEDLYDKLLNWTNEEFVEWFQSLKLLHSVHSVSDLYFRSANNIS